MIISVNTKTPIQSMFYNIVACKVGKCDFYDIWTIKEHVLVATGGKCCCWKCWSSRQGCAAREHALVAAVSKSRSRQAWSSCQRRADREHGTVAVVGKCSSWQCWGSRQGLATLEHAGVAIVLSRYVQS